MTISDILCEINYFLQSFRFGDLVVLLNKLDIKTSKLKSSIFLLSSWMQPISNISERLYCLLNGITKIPKCANSKCNNDVKYANNLKKFREFCSTSCNMQINSSMKTQYRFKHGENISGSNNGRWNDNRSYVEIHGLEKAKKLKENIIQRMTGVGNPMFGKPAPIGSGNGWSGWYKGIYFRSLLELSLLKNLIDNNIKFENGELKKHAIEYMDHQFHRNYFPDYVLEDGTILEVKPIRLINSYINKLKFNAAKEKHGDNFKILTENNIKRIELKELKELINNEYVILDDSSKKKLEKYKKKIG